MLSSYSAPVSTLTTFSGYNPPKFVTDAAKQALDRVDCNQYSPTKVGARPAVILSEGKNNGDQRDVQD